MCTVLLPPGDNPIAVNKYINILSKWPSPLSGLCGPRLEPSWAALNADISQDSCMRGMAQSIIQKKYSHVPGGTDTCDPIVKVRRPRGTKPVWPARLPLTSVSSCERDSTSAFVSRTRPFLIYLTRTFQNYKRGQFQPISVYRHHDLLLWADISIQCRTQEFCSGGGVQQIQLRTEDREKGDRGAVAP